MKGSHSFRAAPSAPAATNLGQVRLEKTLLKNTSQLVKINLRVGEKIFIMTGFTIKSTAVI